MFTPWSFSPLVLRPALWLDASDASTLYRGASLAAADGAISEWRDKSGNARHATQATGVSQPLRKTSIQNGRDVVRFDGVNDFMKAPCSNTANYSVYIVAKRTASNINEFNNISFIAAIGVDGDVAVAKRLTQLTYTDTPIFQFSGRTGAPSVPTHPRNDNWNLHGLVSKIGDSATYRLNGTAATAQTLAGQESPVGSLVMTIGVPSWAFLFHFNGDIAEILLFPSALSDGDRQAVESYLNSKWNLY